MFNIHRLAVLGLLVMAQVGAEPVAIPKEISGRWTYKNYSNLFSLEDMAPTADAGFSARLTWWTRKPECVIRDQAITGRQTDTGIAFDAMTRCDVRFTAELSRGGDGWVGKATTDQGVVVDMRAK